MPIFYNHGDIFESNADAIINTVNCVGVMGAGLAKQFKERYPHNYTNYANACKTGKVEIGKMYIPNVLSPNKIIVNFPTKKHWRSPSQLSYIDDGLTALREYIDSAPIQSIAIPPLGCGLGGLNWQDDVHPLIQSKLADCTKRIELYVPDKPHINGNVTKDGPRVLVTGGRHYSDHTNLANALSTIGPSQIIHGAATGADTLSGQFADTNGLEVRRYPVTPEAWNTVGKSAGIKRNMLMLDTEKPDMVLAFPGGNGTAHMTSYAHSQGYRVLKVDETGMISFDTLIINMRNHENECPAGAIRVDRGTGWGNPNRMENDGMTERLRVIHEYEITLRNLLTEHAETIASIIALAGHTIACWCTPQPCHANIIAYYGNHFATKQLYETA